MTDHKSGCKFWIFFSPNWELGLVFNDSPQKWLQKKQNGQKVPI